MDKTIVFSKTGKGLAELTLRKLGLSDHAYGLLALADGNLSLYGLLRQADGLEVAEGVELIKMLEDHRLIRELTSHHEGDVLMPGDAAVSVVELDMEESVRAWAQAKRSAQNLKDTGFFAENIHPMRESRQPSILLVEDDVDLAEVVAILLEAQGFVVAHVASGKELLARLAVATPDLMILDVMLPDTTGFKILTAMRADPRFKSLPIIMLTARTSDEDVMVGLQGGADGYIFKPFKEEPLVRCIRKVLNI